MNIPEVEEIIHRTTKRGEEFTVRWSDNTNTTVRLLEGDESDEYTAFVYALGKKIFGDKGTGRDFIRKKKRVFEDRMARKEHERKLKRNLQKRIQESENEDVADVSNIVYEEMFVAPCLVSRAVFKRNR